jgi:hypothetical protein
VRKNKVIHLPCLVIVLTGLEVTERDYFGFNSEDFERRGWGNARKRRHIERKQIMIAIENILN